MMRRIGVALLVAACGGGGDGGGGGVVDGGSPTSSGGPSAGGTLGTVVTALPDRIVALVADDADLYYRTNANDYAILRVPKTGGAPETLATGRSLLNASLAVDDTSVYFGDEAYEGTPNAVRVLPKAGGAATTLVPDQSPARLLVDGTSVWLGEENAVYRADKTGANLTKISDASCYVAFAEDAANLYCVRATGELVRVKKDASETKTLFTPPGAGTTLPVSTPIAVVGTKAYYALNSHHLGGASDCALYEVDVVAGTGAALSNECATSLTADDSGIYITQVSAADPLGGVTIARLPREGGAPTPLTPAGALKEVGAPIVDAGHIYYSGKTQTGWALYSLAK